MASSSGNVVPAIAAGHAGCVDDVAEGLAAVVQPGSGRVIPGRVQVEPGFSPGRIDDSVLCARLRHG